MLKTAIPTLEINTTRADLTQVKTITITIRQNDSTISKGNSSIIINNSVISVALTQEEADRFKQGNSSISVKAVGYNDEPYNIWVSWVKLGSRSSFSGGENPEQPDNPVTPPQPEDNEMKQVIKTKYVGSAAQRYGANFKFYFDDFDINKLTNFTISKIMSAGFCPSSFSTTLSYLGAGILYKDASGTETTKQLAYSNLWTTNTNGVTQINITNKEYDLQELYEEIGNSATALSGIYIDLHAMGSTNENIFRFNEITVEASVQYTT